MQSSGPPYQGTVGAGVNYSERQYESQMSSHCHSGSYPSYQPSSPYRPHPVSPQTHSHQFNSHGNHQMHSGIMYGSGHQLGFASPPQAHFGTPNQEVYSNRHNIYNSGNRNVQQVKTPWVDNNSSSNNEIMQNYSQSSSRSTMMVNPPHMPPPSIRSPPHGTVSATSNQALTPAHHHYRSLPVGSSPNQSPHSWSQTQIPSPSLLHSPRTTPSPLPGHSRSPGHNQPFSPPPTTPSPHHPPSSVTPHPAQQSKVASSSPSSNCQTPNQTTGSDPLQSLQKMVMLETDNVENAVIRPGYEIPNSHSNPPNRSYFSSVEQLASSNPGSPYPTYYNLDQNRLCTPPCTRISTPTTPTYSSIPDSVSNSSASSDSRTDTTNVNQQNGEINHSNDSEIHQDYGKMNIASKANIMNGDEKKIEQISNNENSEQEKDVIINLKENCNEWSNRLPSKLECSMRNETKDVEISSSGSQRSNNYDIDIEFSNSPQDAIIEKQLKSKSMLPPTKRLIIQEVAVSNGPIGNGGDSNSDTLFQTKFNCTLSKWNNVESCDNHHNSDGKECLSDGSSLFDKQYSSTHHLAQHTSQCNLVWAKKDIKSRHIGKDLSSDLLIDRNESKSNLNSLEGIVKKPVEICQSPLQKLNDVGISNFLGKEERKEIWQHPDLYVGQSPSEEKSLEEGPLARDVSITNTCIPLKTTSEPLLVPLSGNKQSDESKLNRIPMATSPEDLSKRDVSYSVRSDDNTPSHSQYGEDLPKKKRGRPFGSKNKPKTPQGEKSEKKTVKRKKSEVVEPEPTKKKIKAFNGPHVHITGTRDKPISITVINVAPKEEVKDVKYQKQKREFHIGNSLRKKFGVGHTSTLSPHYDAFTKDKTWVCALCQKGSHYRSLGDLFGPYYLNDDQNPVSSTSTNCAVTVNVEKSEQKDTNGLNKNAFLNRRVRSRRKRSELVEEFFKASMSKKSKQVKKSTENESTESSSLPAATSTTAATTTTAGSSSGNEFWIHEDCALWSHGVCFNGQRVHGLADAVKEASSMICSKCKLKGATLGCLNKGCTEQYHYICAQDKGCEMDEENFSLLCPKHRKRSHGEKRIVE